MRTIRVVVSGIYSHIDYENGHTRTGTQVLVYEEGPNGVAYTDREPFAWFETSSTMPVAVKLTTTNGLKACGVRAFTPADRLPSRHEWSVARWTDNASESHRTFVLPDVAPAGIRPALRQILAGSAFTVA